MDVDLPEYNDDAYSEEGIIVPETPNPLGETEYASFLERISAVERTDPWDTSQYLYALQSLDTLLSH